MRIAIPGVGEDLHPRDVLLFLVVAVVAVVGLHLLFPQVIPWYKPPQAVAPPAAERHDEQTELASGGGGGGVGGAEPATNAAAQSPSVPPTQVLPAPPAAIPGPAIPSSQELAPPPPPAAAVAGAPKAAARHTAQARAFDEARARQAELATARARVDADRWASMMATQPPPAALVLRDTGISALVLRDTGTAAAVASKDPIAQAGALTPGAREEPVVWNYWLTLPAPTASGSATRAAPGARPRPDTSELDLQTLHRLSFRLSTLDLSAVLGGVAAVGASPALKSTLEAALAESSRKLLEFEVLITPSDEQRLRIPMTDRRLAMSIDLDRIRSLGSTSAGGQTSVTEADIQKATVAEFGFDFRILVAGTHQAGITIVDTRTALPVQSMVINLKSGTNWPQSVDVDASPQGYFRPSGAPADLLLVLDALESEVDGSTYRSLAAKLYYRKPGAPAPSDGSGYGFITWTSQLDFDSLWTQSEGYRKTIGDNKNAEALLDKAYWFAHPLFSPRGDIEDGKYSPMTAKENSLRAAKARQVILDAATDSASSLPPTFVVQINKRGFQDRYKSPVLPIAAMGIAKDDKQPRIFLGEKFALALGLSGQDYSAGRPCPRDWYLALPQRAELKDEALTKALDSMKPMAEGWQKHYHPQTLELSPLKDWLSAPDEASKNLPFVLSYIGHYDGGSLSLAKNTAGIIPGGILRDFQGSSIAILNACDTAMEVINNGTPIGMLAESRVAAIVATTSPIGGDLAGDYMVCMSSVLAAHQDGDLNIGQVHALTTRCLFASGEGKPGLFNYSGSALKYLLIGNPFQRICAPNPGGPPVLPVIAPPIKVDEDQPS